jgi:hypothetical protein
MALRPLRSVVASAAGDSFQGKRSSGVDGVSASTRRGGVWRGRSAGELALVEGA